ncbi:MAG TPA: gliding motility-associated protein GldE [Chitinophagaceae bacterium]|nr:gliding motility-associated protein GldE [Chitinophagaceae bacterium]
MDPDSEFTPLLFSLLQTQLSTNAHLILGLLIIILLILTALIAGSEVAFFSLSAKDINYIKQKEDPGHKTILNLIEQPKRLLATLLIGNNFLSIGVIISTNLLFSSLIDLKHIFPQLNEHYLSLVNILIQVVLVTFLLVLFGEVLPKVYATQNNLRLSLFTAPFIKFLDKLFGPVSNFLVNSTGFIERRLSKSKKSDISNEDVEHAIALTVGHSASREEVNIFKGILKFSEITAKQIMRTRLDVSALDYNWDFEKVKAQVLETGFSRLPVYIDSLDEIKGILYTKDLLAFLDETHPDWHTLIRPGYFVPESKLIEDLLKEFQHKRSHMAIVVDEFGGTSGILTLEDIMEEIIGEIKDEFDEDELMAKKIDEHNYLFEGKTLINDVCRIISVPAEVFEEVRGESDSLAGMVLEIAGKFPMQNEVVSFENFDFTVIQLDKLRLQKIKLTIHPKQVAVDA